MSPCTNVWIAACKVYWNVPIAGNLRFVSRDAQLDRLENTLFAETNHKRSRYTASEELADAKKLVQRHLGQDSAGQWLLVVDNVDDMDIWNNELKGYLPRSNQGCVVCTTRSRKVAVNIAAANVMEV